MFGFETKAFTRGINRVVDIYVDSRNFIHVCDQSGLYCYTASFDLIQEATMGQSSLISSVITNFLDICYRKIHGHGEYIYAALGKGGLKVIRFDGERYKVICGLNQSFLARDFKAVYTDGNFIYAACGLQGLRVFYFNGNNIKEVDSRVDLTSYEDVWGDGTYIYTANGNAGVKAFQFDQFLYCISETDPGQNYTSIHCNSNGYIYATCGEDGVSVFRFTNDQLGFITRHHSVGDYSDVFVNGDYSFVAAKNAGFFMYSFDGSSLTVEGQKTGMGTAYACWMKGTQGLYVAHWSNGMFWYNVLENYSSSSNSSASSESSFRCEIYKELVMLDDDRYGSADYKTITYDKEKDIIYCAITGIKCTTLLGYRFNGMELERVDVAFKSGAWGGRGGQRGEIVDVYKDVYDNIFIADAERGFLAYRYINTGLDLLSSEIPQNGDATAVSGRAGMIYFAATDGLYAYRFIEDQLNVQGVLEGNFSYVRCDARYIYAIKSGTLYAYSFRNGQFIEEGSTANLTSSSSTSSEGSGFVPDSVVPQEPVSPTSLYINNRYIYTANGTAGIACYEFGGQKFRLIDRYQTVSANEIDGDRKYIYVADGTGGIKAFDWDETSSSSSSRMISTSISKHSGFSDSSVSDSVSKAAPPQPPASVSASVSKYSQSSVSRSKSSYSASKYSQRSVSRSKSSYSASKYSQSSRSQSSSAWKSKSSSSSSSLKCDNGAVMGDGDRPYIVERMFALEVAGAAALLLIVGAGVFRLVQLILSSYSVSSNSISSSSFSSDSSSSNISWSSISEDSESSASSISSDSSTSLESWEKSSSSFSSSSMDSNDKKLIKNADATNNWS